MCDECTWHHKTFLVQLYWHLAIKLYCITPPLLVSCQDLRPTEKKYVRDTQILHWSSQVCNVGQLLLYYTSLRNQNVWVFEKRKERNKFYFCHLARSLRCGCLEMKTSLRICSLHTVNGLRTLTRSSSMATGIISLFLNVSVMSFI